MALAFFDDEDDAQNIQQNQSTSRVLAVIFGFIALASFLMLMSYSIDDPSLTNPTASEVQNIFGRSGAFISDILIRFVGFSAYIIPLVFAIFSVKLWLGGAVNLLKLLYLPAPMAICAAYLSSWVPLASWPFQGTGMGGVLGDMLFKILIAFVPLSLSASLFLSTLLLFCMTMLSIMYLCDISIHLAMRFIARGFRDAKWLILAIFGGAMGGAAHFGQVKNRNKNVVNKPFQKAQNPAFHSAPRNEGAPFYQRETLPVEALHDKGSTFNIHSVTHQNSALHSPYQEQSNEPQIGSSRFASEKTRLSDRAHKASDEAFLERNQESGTPKEKLSIQDRIRDVVSRNSKDHEAMLRLRSYENRDSDFEGNILENAALPSISPHYSEDIDSYEPQSPKYHAPSVPILPKSAQPKLDFGAFAPGKDERRPILSPQSHESIVQHNKPSKPQISGRAKAESEPHFSFAVEEKPFELPPLSLLNSPDYSFRQPPSTEALEASAIALMNVLEEYGIQGEITAVKPGPVVTMFELEPAAGLKASRVIGLAEDIARSMSALTARVATVPGRSVIGIELPNDQRETVYLREVLSAKQYGDSQLALPLALGKNIGGEPIIANLQKMPHLLVAGTTGSGKSVAINTMILSLLYHATPEQVRMIMIDPKMLELSVYDDIPHLLSPVVTDPKKAVIALKWAVSEMEERYRKMSKMGVRTIESYNARIADCIERGEAFARTIQTGFDEITGEAVFENEEYSPEKLPYIVIIVDEMADLMMVAGKEIDACIQRLAQMARASGIHLIMATQRPSVDVITGTIKSNFPTRISFQVASKIDSRTILNEMGAEQLLGQGDMLYMSGGARPVRVHGPFVSDEEVEEVVRYLKAQSEPNYVAGVVEGPDDEKAADIDAVLGLSSGSSDEDELYDQAVRIVAKDQKCSTSYIQRKLSIGYNKAAKIVERMEENDIVSPANHVGKRDVLIGEI